MLRRFDLYTRVNQMVVGCILFALSFGAAYLIRFDGLVPWQFAKQFLIWLPYLLAVRIYVNWKMGIYRFIWRYVSLADAIAITRSLAVVTTGSATRAGAPGSPSASGRAAGGGGGGAATRAGSGRGRGPSPAPRPPPFAAA